MKAKFKNLKMAMLTFVFLLSIIAALPMSASAADIGDIFTANTIEGVPVTYQITALPQGVLSGTVQIGTGAIWGSAISTFTAGTVTIPDLVTDMFNHYRVTDVSYNAFYDLTAVKKIILPSNIATINAEAFLNCGALEEVTLPDNLQTIKQGAFSTCPALEKVDLPNTLKTIEDNVFYGCTSLIKVVIPNSVTTLGDSIFESCDSLEEVIFPDHITSIPEGTFSDCFLLTDVKLPEKLATVGSSAFYGCSSLTDISFNENLTSIGDFAFEDCSSLADVYLISKNLPSIGSDTFTNTNNPLNIHILSTADITSDPKWAALATNPSVNIIRDVFVLTFDLLGGTLDSGVTEHLVLQGGSFAITDAPVASKVNHSFEDWYEDAAITNLATFPYAVNSDKTLYARWDLSLPPSVSKNSLKMITLGSDSTLGVSLGVGRAAATSATVSSDNTAIMAVTPANLAVNGNLTVNSNSLSGTANIIITWVGGQSNGQTVTIPVTVSKPVSPTKPQIDAIYVNGVAVPYKKHDDVLLLNNTTSIMKEIELNGNPQKVHVFDGSAINDINEIRLPVPSSWFNTDGDKLHLKHEKIGSIYIEDSMFKGQESKLSTNDVIFILRKSSLEVKITHGTKPFEWQSFNKPLLISMPFSGDEYTVMYDKNNPQKITPRSIYKDDKQVWAKVYAPGIYNAKTNTPESFLDTAGKWMDSAVKFTTARGVTLGIGSNKFAPENSITRADFTAMLVRALGVDTSTAKANNFKDNSSIPNYAREAVNFAAEKEIVHGSDTGYFSPNSHISRQDMFILTYRAMEKFGIIPDDVTGKVSDFADWSQVSNYAKYGIKILTQLNIVNGYNGKLSPNGSSSRGETAQLISKILKLDMD